MHLTVFWGFREMRFLLLRRLSVVSSWYDQREYLEFFTFNEIINKKGDRGFTPVCVFKMSDSITEVSLEIVQVFQHLIRIDILFYGVSRNHAARWFDMIGSSLCIVSSINFVLLIYVSQMNECTLAVYEVLEMQGFFCLCRLSIVAFWNERRKYLAFLHLTK